MKAVGAFSVKSYNQQRRDARQMIIKAARELQMMVVPEGGSLFYMNETMVQDGHTGVEHSLPVPHVYNDVVTLFATSGVGLHADADRRLRRAVRRELLVPAPGRVGEHSGCSPSRRATSSTRARAAARWLPRTTSTTSASRRARRRFATPAARVQLGAHGQLQGLGAHWELWMLAQGGMTPLRRCAAATIDGARYLGLDKDIGSLEPGKLADLVVLDRNPLDGHPQQR